MRPVFYTRLDLNPHVTLAQICRIAHTLGYELVRFAGYSNADLGYAGNRGPKWEAARANRAAILEILAVHARNCKHCYCSIFHCAEDRGHALEDDEGLQIIRGYTDTEEEST